MEEGFWAHHGIIFCLFLFVFPRLTMLFGTSVATAFGGWLFWLGWLFAPRLTVAIIGTTLYWDTDPVLCVVAWMWALSGEGAEKGAAGRAGARRSRRVVVVDS